MRREGRSGSWITAGFVEDYTYTKGTPLQETSGTAGVYIASRSEMLSRNKQMPQEYNG